MPAYYTYLVSSLPMLHFQGKPPFSFKRFIETAIGLIPEKNIEALKSVSISGQYSSQAINPTLKQWYDFDTLLRNELVKLRAARKKISPAVYLRGTGYAWPNITRIAVNAQKTLAPLEAEKLVDGERWRFLDGLSAGHYFDFEYLLIYALKLLILERWMRIKSADKNKILEDVLA